MKKSGLLVVAAMLITGVSFAGGERRNSNRMSKADYVAHVESQLTEWDRRVTQLKAERDALNTSSDRYKVLNKAVGDLEDEVADIREELRDLRGDQNPNLAEYRVEIEKNFVDAKAISERTRVAE